MIKYMVIETYTDPEDPQPYIELMRYGFTDIQDAEASRYEFLVENQDVLPDNISVVQYQA